MDQAISAAASQKIRTLSSGTVADDDYTVLISGDVTLPSATSQTEEKSINSSTILQEM
jgi:hypothetical protein